VPNRWWRLVAGGVFHLPAGLHTKGMQAGGQQKPIAKTLYTTIKLYF